MAVPHLFCTRDFAASKNLRGSVASKQNFAALPQKKDKEKRILMQFLLLFDTSQDLLQKISRNYPKKDSHL